jgi:hypothetical protein
MTRANRSRLLSAGVALVAIAVAACGTEAPQRPGPAPASSAETTPSGTPSSGTDRAAAPDLAERFLLAANRGDSAVVAELFAEDARFDSVGRIYSSREEILDRFLDPEVIAAGGRYTATSASWHGDRYRVHYDYATGHGGQETFYYDYLVRDGQIQDVIGRYS